MAISVDTSSEARAAPFLTGVNYWPADSAMHWWARFDLEVARADLRRLAESGFGVMRFFLRWEDFQPAPDVVSEGALRHLEEFADAAAAAGIRLQPSLFTGHMSGTNWLPAFATVSSAEPQRFTVMVGGCPAPGRAPANFYEQESVAAAQELLAREVARTLARHPALWSWDLGNEHSNVAIPSTVDAGRRWLARMVEALRSGGSEHPVTIGLHMEDLDADRRLGPRQAAEVCAYQSMHGYPAYSDLARSGTDPSFVCFLGLVSVWLGGQPVLLQEFGLPTAAGGRGAGAASPRHQVFSEAEGADYGRAVLRELRRERFLGAFAWCMYDYATSLWEQPPLRDLPHERHFGLFRANGEAKRTIEPWLAVNSGVAAAPDASPRGVSWIDIDQAVYWRSPHDALRRLYTKFTSL